MLALEERKEKSWSKDTMRRNKCRRGLEDRIVLGKSVEIIRKRIRKDTR